MLVELRISQVSEDAVAARVATRSADRNVTGFRAQLAADLAKLHAEMRRITALVSGSG